MAQQSTHFSYSFLLGLAYAGFGLTNLGLPPQVAGLAGIIVLLAGMIPDMDSTNGSKDFAALLGVIAPLIVFREKPEWNNGQMSQVALITLTSFFATKITAQKILGMTASRRGIFHSIPFALIIGCCGYLLVPDLPRPEREYMGIGALGSVIVHLLLDVFSNYDSNGGQISGKFNRFGPLKLFSMSVPTSVITYLILGALAFRIASDYDQKVSDMQDKVVAKINEISTNAGQAPVLPPSARAQFEN